MTFRLALARCPSVGLAPHLQASGAGQALRTNCPTQFDRARSPSAMPDASASALRHLSSAAVSCSMAAVKPASESAHCWLVLGCCWIGGGFESCMAVAPKG